MKKRRELEGGIHLQQDQSAKNSRQEENKNTNCDSKTPYYTNKVQVRGPCANKIANCLLIIRLGEETNTKEQELKDKSKYMSMVMGGQYP
jgi:hypothetical protein